jgi:hypothetical protein
MAFLVDQGKWWDAADNFPWHHPQVGECSDSVQGQLHHAELFSLLMHGAALLYKLMLAEKRALGRSDGSSVPESLVIRYRKDLGDWYQNLEDQYSAFEHWVKFRAKFWGAIHLVNQRIPVPTVHFINAWMDLTLGLDGVDALIDSRSARDLIHHRERRLKRTLARLDNPRALETWSGAAGTHQLSYRWQPAQVILQDILRGLGRGCCQEK